MDTRGIRFAGAGVRFGRRPGDPTVASKPRELGDKPRELGDIGARLEKLLY